MLHSVVKCYTPKLHFYFLCVFLCSLFSLFSFFVFLFLRILGNIEDGRWTSRCIHAMLCFELRKVPLQAILFTGWKQRGPIMQKLPQITQRVRFTFSVASIRHLIQKNISVSCPKQMFWLNCWAWLNRRLAQRAVCFSDVAKDACCLLQAHNVYNPAAVHNIKAHDVCRCTIDGGDIIIVWEQLRQRPWIKSDDVSWKRMLVCSSRCNLHQIIKSFPFVPLRPQLDI